MFCCHRLYVATVRRRGASGPSTYEISMISHAGEQDLVEALREPRRQLAERDARGR